jgi:phospholipid/cholesterol/gamma-HCH transport system substrate-binding protein
MRRRLAVTIAVLATTAPLVAGCGFSLNQLPSTGGVSGSTYRLTAHFDDVGDLTVGAKVKLQGVVIGQVEAITTRNYDAAVAIDVSRKFALPAASRFEIRFTTPLGEDYISVTAPKDTGGPTLGNGDTVSAQHTAEAPTIEDTFAALSLLLNGGGLDKLQVIVRELGTGLHGHVGAARDTLLQLRKVVGDLDAHKGDIDHLLTGMQQLSAQLDQRSGLISTALEQFPQTIDLLARDTAAMRSLLEKVGELGDTVRGLLDRGQQALLDDLDGLRPTLDALAASRNSLIPTFNSLVKFGDLFDRATPGDYLNLFITVQVPFAMPPQHPKQPGATVASPATSPSDAIASLLTGGLR